MMKVRLARNQVGRGERTAEAAFIDLQGDVKELLTDLREVARNPPARAVRRWPDRGRAGPGGQTPARCSGDRRFGDANPPVRPRRRGRGLFVICEALTNVAKHSAATGTEVAVWTLGDQVVGAGS